MIYIGGDHRGFELKEYLRNRLIDDGVEVFDVGAATYDSGDDYVDFANDVAAGVLRDPKNIGVLLCGSGVGVDIVANKHDGIRCSLVQDIERAKMSREHEDANVLALPADIVDQEEAYRIVKIFLGTEFSGEERHERRLEKIVLVEKSN